MLREIFTRLDRNNDGCVNMRELILSIRGDKELEEQLMGTITKQRSGAPSTSSSSDSMGNESAASSMVTMTPSERLAALTSGFKAYDRDGSGTIEWEEFLQHFENNVAQFTVVDRAVLEAKKRGNRYMSRQRQEEQRALKAEREHRDTIQERQRHVEAHARRAFEAERLLRQQKQASSSRNSAHQENGGEGEGGEREGGAELSHTIPVFSSDGAVSELGEGNDSQADTSVSLEIGSRVFKAQPRLFTAFPESMLGQIFLGKHQVKPNDKRRYIFDRNPAYFEAILEFYRNPHTVIINPNVSVQGVQSEARYFGMYGPMFTQAGKREQRERRSKLGVNNPSTYGQTTRKKAKTRSIAGSTGAGGSRRRAGGQRGTRGDRASRGRGRRGRETDDSSPEPEEEEGLDSSATNSPSAKRFQKTMMRHIVPGMGPAIFSVRENERLAVDSAVRTFSLFVFHFPLNLSSLKHLSSLNLLH